MTRMGGALLSALKPAPRVKAGPPLAAGQHPLSFVDPPPSHGPFKFDQVLHAVRPSGWQVVIASGTCPDLLDLEGFVLVATERDGKLVFGGVHPKIRDGADAPFRHFFEVMPSTVESVGLLQEAVQVDLLVSKADGTIESFIFRFIPWRDFLAARKDAGDDVTITLPDSGESA